MSQVAPQGGSQHERRCREAREQVCVGEQVRPQALLERCRLGAGRGVQLRAAEISGWKGWSLLGL